MIIGISGKAGSGKDTVGDIIEYLTLYNGDITKTLDSIEYNSLDICETLWKRKLFAYKLKEIVCTLTGCTMKNLESQEFKLSKLPKEWEVVKLTKEDGTWFVKTIKEFEKEFPNNNFIDECETITKLRDLGVVRFGKFIPSYREFLQIIGTDLFRTFIHPDVWVISTLSDYNPNENWLVTDCRFINEVEAILNKGGILIRINRENNTSNNSTHASEVELDNYTKFHYIIDNNKSIKDLVEKIKEIMVEINIL